MATWPSGKARVCKTLITGSNPVVASLSEHTLIIKGVFLFQTSFLPMDDGFE
jgi:hypothetical protein